MGKAKEIFEGWSNLISKDEYVEKIAAIRLEVCEACDDISTKHKTVRPDVHCFVCKCPLASKTRSLSSECPKKLWTSVNIKDNGK